jgi:hypothetical protein
MLRHVACRLCITLVKIVSNTMLATFAQAFECMASLSIDIFDHGCGFEERVDVGSPALLQSSYVDMQYR